VSAASPPLPYAFLIALSWIFGKTVSLSLGLNMTILKKEKIAKRLRSGILRDNALSVSDENKKGVAGEAPWKKVRSLRKWAYSD